MCGIFGYISAISKKTKGYNPVGICLEGLKLLEYRGYDSSGIAGMVGGELRSCKRKGKVESLIRAVESEDLHLDFAIAHTRWATHGMPNQANAHPHFDQMRSLAIVHNGIIENHNTIREKLEKKGIAFASDTDSEVIAQLIAYNYQGNLKQAVQKSLKELQGSFAIALIHTKHVEEIVAASRESPLILGVDQKQEEFYVASDANSFNGKSLDILHLKDDEVAILNKNRIEVFDSHEKRNEKRWTRVAFENAPISKNGFEHFMLKEIFEQPQAMQQAMQRRCREEFGTATFEELEANAQELQSINRILILGCGTSWHAGKIGALMFEEMARIPTEAKIASEFRYANPIVLKGTLVIAMSQSGETADTIAAVKEAKAKGAKVISICNREHSTLDRIADQSLRLMAGPEMSVCSTKAFTSQLILLALFALCMARMRHMNREEGQNFLKEIKHLPTKITQILSQVPQIESFAERYAHYRDFFFLGRSYMYPTGLEAALKLKEISYLHASGYPAGELKHGPIALVNHKLVAIGMCGNAQTFDKMMSNLMEIDARGGRILAFAPKGRNEVMKITPDILWLPKTSDVLAPILYSVAGQLFAYFIAKIRGTDIDQPRNLAKSVTVE